MPFGDWVSSCAVLVCAAVLSSSATSSAGTAGSAAAGSLATTRVSDEAFDLELRPVGRYKAGRAGEAEVVLIAKGSYKVNDKYPFKFEFAQRASIKPEKPVVTSEAMVLGRKQATMRLSFTPRTAGLAEIAGEFKFSVCTDDRCLVERQELSLGVEVQ